MTDVMARWDADWLPALAVGRLSGPTLTSIRIGRQLHHRAGPWVALEPEESRFVRLLDREKRPNPAGTTGDAGKPGVRNGRGTAATRRAA